MFGTRWAKAKGVNTLSENGGKRFWEISDLKVIFENFIARRSFASHAKLRRNENDQYLSQIVAGNEVQWI